MTLDVVCDRCRDQLIDYAAGTLPVEARDLLARHLESCSACTRELEQWQEIGVAVRGTSVPLPSEPFATAWGNLQAQLDAVPSGLETKAVTYCVEVAVKPWSPPYPPRSTGGRMRVLAACAAMLALVVVSAAVFTTLAIHRTPLASGTATATARGIAVTATTAKNALQCAVADKNGNLLVANPPTALVTMPPPVPSVPAAKILDFVAQAAGTPVFNTDAPAGSSYRYEPPVLVLPATYGDTADFCAHSLPHYVVLAPVSNGNLAVYDVVYNPTTQQLRLFSMSSSWPSPGNIPAGDYFPLVGVSSSAAVATLRSAKSLAPARGTRPELVYFAPRARIYGDDPSVTLWTGGGDDAIRPMWRLHGADGKLYFVGIDGKVYTSNQLPILPGTTFITNE